MAKTKGTVLYIGGFELPDKNPAAHRVLNNAKILRELGYNVVFCGIDKNKKTELTNAELVCDFESYPLPYPNTTKKWIKQMIDISPYSNLVLKYGDIKYIFCYNLHAVPLAKLIKFAKKRKIKLIADCTEWYEHNFSFNPIKLIKCIDTFFCMRYLQKKCDGMIAISNFLADYYKKYIKNIVVIPPLVDLTDKKYKRVEKTNTITTFVYSGSPSASKEALGEVVRCFNKFDDLNFKFKVVGITQEQFKEIYGIEPNLEKIEFLGRVSHKEALEAVKRSDYSLIIRPASRVTMAGFPTKFVEAISCGTAVIANESSDLKQYFKDGKNGFLVNIETLECDLRNIILNENIPFVECEIFDYRFFYNSVDALLKRMDYSV